MVEFGNITIGGGGGGWKRYKRVTKLKSKDKSLFLHYTKVSQKSHMYIAHRDKLGIVYFNIE